MNRLERLAAWKSWLYGPIDPSEGHLELPDAQHIVLPEILERPLTGHSQGGTAHGLAAHPDGVGVGAGVVEGGDAVGAHVVVAAVAARVVHPVQDLGGDVILPAGFHIADDVLEVVQECHFKLVVLGL